MGNFVIVPRPKNSKQGKKHRKHGRTLRKPCQQRYTNQRRWEINKKRRAQQRTNKLGVVVKIKVEGEWVLIKPKKARRASEDALPICGVYFFLSFFYLCR